MIRFTVQVAEGVTPVTAKSNPPSATPVEAMTAAQKLPAADLVLLGSPEDATHAARKSRLRNPKKPTIASGAGARQLSLET